MQIGKVKMSQRLLFYQDSSIFLEKYSLDCNKPVVNSIVLKKFILITQTVFSVVFMGKIISVHLYSIIFADIIPGNFQT